LKAYPQFLQDNELSFQDFHNFHKQESHTCKKSFCKEFQGFQNQFVEFSNSLSSALTLFSSHLFNPFKGLFKRANQLASS